MNGEDRRHLAGAEAADVRSAVPDKLLYTVEEAAALLSLSRTSVFQLISEHRLAAVKIGGRRRVAHRALDDFVASLETAGHPEEHHP
jgi:excisionase family DNA binding protein